MNHNNPSDEAFVRCVRARARRDVHELDDDATRALRLARERALDASTGSRRRAWPLLAAAASIAVLAVIGLRVVNERQPGDVELFTAQDVMHDLDLLTEDEDLTLLEDLEFYAWLSAVDEDVS